MFVNKPPGEICPMCYREYGSTSIYTHMKQCAKKHAETIDVKKRKTMISGSPPKRRNVDRMKIKHQQCCVPENDSYMPIFRSKKPKETVSISPKRGISPRKSLPYAKKVEPIKK